MICSLKTLYSTRENTQDAILMALKTPIGVRTIWAVVESEDDVKVYQKFLNPTSTIVKTSEDKKGKRGCGNVALIVEAIKTSVPHAYIFGIRDADYIRYQSIPVALPSNVFLTDSRDLEMLLLESQIVRSELEKWATGYVKAIKLCTPLCRYFGYLRIYNMEKGLNCIFHDKLKTSSFWDFTTQSLSPDWKNNITQKFLHLTNYCCTETDINAFIESNSLEEEPFSHICRGHDLLKILPLALVNSNVYSEKNIMNKMMDSYSIDDFKKTQLYAEIQKWQVNEHVTVLVA